MEITVLESPYAGDVNKHTRYARACIADMFRRREVPFASHLLYTQPGILNDSIPEERELGITAGVMFYENTSKSAVYVDFGISKGMMTGIETAIRFNRPVVIRKLNGKDFYFKENRPQDIDTKMILSDPSLSLLIPYVIYLHQYVGL